MDVEIMTQKSFENRALIRDETACGCYCCLLTFAGFEIEEWTDKGSTALCPRCDVDAVLPNVTDEKTLQAGLERWFCEPA